MVKKFRQAVSLITTAVLIGSGVFFSPPVPAINAAAAEKDSAAPEGISGSMVPVEEEIEEEVIELSETEELYGDDSEEASVGHVYNARPDTIGTVFYRDRLSENEALVYDALTQSSSCDGTPEYIAFNTYSCTADDTAGARAQDPITSGERLLAACAVLFDHPEIYWTQNIKTKYTYRKKGTDFTVTTSVCFVDNLPGDHSAAEEESVNAARRLLAGLDASGSDAALACRIHEALAGNTEYRECEPGTDAYVYSHSAYGALVQGYAVCDGYAKAYHMLLSLSGIPSAVISGPGHAWNILRLGGEWYECDVTWDDQMEAHWYFNKTTEEMSLDTAHKRDTGSVAKYAPQAEGTYYDWDYMQYCGRHFENAGPDGEGAFLSAEKNGKWYRLSDLTGETSWTVGIRKNDGTSLTEKICSGELSSLLTAVSFGRGTPAQLKKNPETPGGDFAVTCSVIYDNGSASTFSDTVKVRTAADRLFFTEDSVDLTIGDKTLLSVRKEPADATDAITFISSDNSVASVEAGLVTAEGNGTCTITAKGEKAEASITVTVCPKASGLTISDTSLSIKKGGQAGLSASLTPAGAKGDIRWETDSPSVAVVDNGKVTALKKGTCVITASCGRLKKTCTVTVISEPEDIAGLVSGTTIYRGKTYALTAHVYPLDAPQEVSFTSNSPDTASVSDTGVITGKSSGECTVMVTAGSVKKTVKVTVKEPPAGISLESGPFTMDVGASRGLKASVLPSQAREEIIYTSSAPSVASVDRTGNVTAESPGEAVITAQVKGTSYKKTCSVKVLLPAPGSAAADVRENGIRVSWDMPDGGRSCEVYRKCGAGTYSRLAVAEGASYIDKSAPYGTACTYKVRYVDKNSLAVLSSFSGEVSAVYLSSPAVKLEGTKEGVRVTWDEVQGADGYRVYMLRQDGTTWKKLGTFTGTSYVHKTAVKGRSYTFKVRCMKDGHLASYKKTGPQMFYTKEPSSPTVQKVNGKAVIKWNRVDRAAGYAVLQKQKNGSWKVIKTTSRTSYTWPVSKRGTSFTIAIRCMDPSTGFFTGAQSTSKTYTIK